MVQTFMISANEQMAFRFFNDRRERLCIYLLVLSSILPVSNYVAISVICPCVLLLLKYSFTKTVALFTCNLLSYFEK